MNPKSRDVHSAREGAFNTKLRYARDPMMAGIVTVIVVCSATMNVAGR